jgi:glycosyltransferase involved in cell wall biosynthesis
MFSVVIPIYNHGKFVRQAIWSALRSPLVKEILIIDDGSGDGSPKIAASMAAAHPGRVRDLTPPSGGNLGAHHRLNELVESAQCEWIAVLNSDDAFVSGRFEAIVRAPQFHDCDFAFGNLLFMDERGALVGAKRGSLDGLAERRFVEILLEENYLITTSNMVFRKSLHASVGGFRSYRYVHDWDFALRAMVCGRTAYIQRFLTAYRIHGGSTFLESEAKPLAEIRTMLESFKTRSSIPHAAREPHSLSTSPSEGTSDSPG